MYVANVLSGLGTSDRIYLLTLVTLIPGQYVLPMLREAKHRWPEDSDKFFVLKYHMLSVVDSIEAVMQSYEAEE